MAATTPTPAAREIRRQRRAVAPGPARLAVDHERAAGLAERRELAAGHGLVAQDRPGPGGST